MASGAFGWGFSAGAGFVGSEEHANIIVIVNPAARIAPGMTRVCFINAFQLRKRVPQELKPAFLKILIGTAAVPYSFLLKRRSRVVRDGASPVSTRHCSARCKAVSFPTPTHERRSGIFIDDFPSGFLFADYCTHPDRK